MGTKDHKIAALVEAFGGRGRDPHYLGFFDCFNRQLYFEAHEVLEPLWLKGRGSPRDLFYKGLIQLAGALVHLQKRRPQPAIALFGLARSNLKGYGPVYDGLDVKRVLEIIEGCLQAITSPKEGETLFPWERAPKLFLMDEEGACPGVV